MTSNTVHLSVDPIQIGSWRAQRVLHICQAFVLEPDPEADFRIVHDDHGQVGWHIVVTRERVAEAVRRYCATLLAEPSRPKPCSRSAAACIVGPVPWTARTTDPQRRDRDAW